MSDSSRSAWPSWWAAAWGSREAELLESLLEAAQYAAHQGAPARLVIASGNPGKLREITAILEGVPVTLKTLADFPGVPVPEETGSDLRIYRRAGEIRTPDLLTPSQAR